MKDKILLAALTLALVFASCGGGGGGGGAGTQDDTGGAGGTVQTIALGEWLVYGVSGHPEYLSNPDEAKKATDFSYVPSFYFYDYGADSYNKPYPLSYFLSGDSSAKVSNAKLTINLGDVKPAYLKDLSNLSRQGYTTTPNDAKYFKVEIEDSEGFFTSDRKYALWCWNGNERDKAYLIYVDRDVTIQGNETWFDSYEGKTRTYIANISAKKGWNYFIYTTTETSTSVTSTETSYKTPPSDYKWYVIDFSIIVRQ